MKDRVKLAEPEEYEVDMTYSCGCWSIDTRSSTARAAAM
jgi:hypothetical protein